MKCVFMARLPKFIILYSPRAAIAILREYKGSLQSRLVFSCSFSKCIHNYDVLPGRACCCEYKLYAHRCISVHSMALVINEFACLFQATVEKLNR